MAKKKKEEALPLNIPNPLLPEEDIKGINNVLRDYGKEVDPREIKLDPTKLTISPHLASGYYPDPKDTALAEINAHLNMIHTVLLTNLSAIESIQKDRNKMFERIVEDLDNIALAAACYHCKDIRNGMKSCPFCKTTVGIKPNGTSND